MRRQLTTLTDLQFLLVAPNLGAEWLFDAARQYWDRFRPTVVSDTRLIRLMPPSRSVAVTVIARRDTVDAIGVELAQFAPLAYFDPVVYDTLEEVRQVLDERANTNQPFGAALATPFPTLDLSGGTPGGDLGAIPTPWLPPTRGPAGFITATPVPPPTSGAGTEPAQTPIQRTPGPISGGGA